MAMRGLSGVVRIGWCRIMIPIGGGVMMRSLRHMSRVIMLMRECRRVRAAEKDGNDQQEREYYTSHG